jgi:NADPH-dependent curcumin reductase CurA
LNDLCPCVVHDFFLSMLELHVYIYTRIHIEYMQSVRVLLNKDCSNVRFQVLKKEFPRGVDIIYESVGGETFDVCLNALAVYGRLIVIGMISQVYF